MVKVKLPEVDTEETRFKKYDFENAKDFYDVLLNFSDTMDNRDRGHDPYYPAISGQLRWIFRGQWKSDWKLLPSAFREPDEHGKKLSEKFRLKTHAHNSPDTLQQNRTGRVIDIKNLISSSENTPQRFKKEIETEYFILRKFMETANSLGIDCNYTPFFYDYHLKMAQANKNYRRNIKGELNKDLENWPDRRILSVMALAQHHRLPTRLLDFTYNPLLAAFFAAKHSFENQFEKITEDEKLCIWAIDEKRNRRNMGVLPNKPWQRIPAPTNRSSNLFAQEGVLILDTEANQRFMDNDGKWQDLISKRRTNNLIKLTLPRKKSKELLRLLWEHNIIPAKIMPSLNSVTQTLEYTQWLWTRNNSPLTTNN